MKFFSEIIVLYDDIAMPSEDLFCPSFWKAENFDSDGDFYWTGMTECWTNLKISKKCDNGTSSDFELNIYREKFRRLDTPPEVAQLARFISYKDSGEYMRYEKINNASNLCIASLAIITKDINDYRVYLETIYSFLSYTDGIAANLLNFDAATFKTEFLDA